MDTDLFWQCVLPNGSKLADKRTDANSDIQVLEIIDKYAF